MIKLLIFCIVFFRIYSLINAQPLAKQREEDYGAQTWTTQGLQLQYLSTTSSRQNKFEDDDATFEEDTPMKNISQNGNVIIKGASLKNSSQDDLEDYKVVFMEDLSMKNTKQNEVEDDNAIFEKEPLMKNRGRNEFEDGDGIFHKDHRKMSFETDINWNTRKRSPNSRSYLPGVTSTRKMSEEEAERESSRSLGHSVTGTKYDTKQNGLLEVLATGKRVEGYKRDSVLLAIKRWLNRRYGYFDYLASSILRK